MTGASEAWDSAQHWFEKWRKAETEVQRYRCLVMETNVSETEKRIAELLHRKKEIDDMNAVGSFTANHRWLLDAVELLLRHQLELIEELRNAGILR